MTNQLTLRQQVSTVTIKFEGPQGSGKTMLMEKIIPLLESEGFTLSVDDMGWGHTIEVRGEAKGETNA
jgi:pantothenate kinase-related protein Tda10